VERPETRYAWNGPTSLAYQVVGDGDVDLLYLQGYASHVDLNWESPHLGRFLRGLARNGRLILTDRRGWGVSERFTPGDVADIDVMTDDVLTVLDAASSERSIVIASYECTIIGTLFAAAHPERVAALVLIDPFVSYTTRPATPWMPSVADWEPVLEDMRREWGTPAWTTNWTEPQEAEWFRRFNRASIAPGALTAEIRRYFDTDISAVLPTVHVPTLVIADADGEFEVPPQTARFVASHVAGARLVEHSSKGGTHRLHWYARGGAILDEIGRFVARVRDEESALDRVLGTVLFTDIVGSTDKLTAVGDRAWAGLLARERSTVRALLARHRGREIDTAGDGSFAVFDGPARAVRCALEIAGAVEPLGISVRAGLHTGELEISGDGAVGAAVHIGARIASLAGPSEVLVSQTVRDLVAGSGLAFTERGVETLKGVPGEWRIFAAALPESR
jgi:class 3 adenylate cyclase